MKRRFIIAVTAVFLVLAIMGAVSAQQDQQNDQHQWRGPRDSHGMRMSSKFQLMRLPRQISQLNADNKLALTRSQAKQILAVLKPFRQKTTMTDDQAKAVFAKVQKVLSKAQLGATSHFGRGFGHGRGPGMGNSAGMGPRNNGPSSNWNNNNRPQDGHGRNPGAFGGRGMMGRFDPAAMKDFNPFYVKVTKGDRFSETRGKRLSAFFGDLEHRAKGR